MQCANSDLDETNALLKEPIAVLRFRYEASPKERPSRPIEQTVSTPFGTVSNFQFEKSSCTVLKLRRVLGQRIMFYNNHTDAVQLIYMLEGEGKLHIDNTKPQQFHSSEHNSVFFPIGSKASVAFTTQADIVIVIISLDKQYFLTRLPIEGSPYRTLINRCSGTNPNTINQVPLHIMPDQFAIFHNIIDCRRQSFIKHHYIKAKIAELLVLHLEQSVYYLMKNRYQDLRDEELQRIYKVRDMLHREPNKSYSLVGLAHAVGTNDATLKKHFKQVFGTTVFAYLTACRMELAKSLLLKNNQQVAMVAQEVGYKYASHFSTAFRKYFGYLPTKLLRMMIAVPSGIMFGELFFR